MYCHSTTASSLLQIIPINPFAPHHAGVRKHLSKRFSLQRKATPIPCNEDNQKNSTGDYQNGLQVINWNQVFDERIDLETLKESASELIKERIEAVRSSLDSMDDGEINISAYDTAWVALVEDVNGSGGPQFPTCLQWIANNQLPDGSWGDKYIFLAHDRLINTFACVIALKSWNIHHGKIEKGTVFIRQNIHKLEDEKAEHMLIGFEVAFPSLLEIAKNLDIDIPYDSHVLKEIYDRRNLKLSRRVYYK